MTPDAQLPTGKPQLQKLQRFAIIVLIAAVIVAAWGIYARLQDRAALRDSTALAAVQIVNVAQPRRSDLADSLTLPGDVQAFTDAPIYARTSGYLKRWYVDIGQPVKAGALLAEIDTPEVDAQLRQAKADLATAQANDSLAQITASRWKSLLGSGTVARQDVDEKQGDADAKRAAVQSARENVRRLEDMESFKHVSAPFDGVVTARHTDIGALIVGGGGGGTELFHLASTHKLRVYVQVPQAYSAAIQPGAKAELRFTNRANQVYTGEVIGNAKSIDTATRTLLTQLQVDNPGSELLPGSYAEVTLPLPPGLNALRVPANALMFRADGLSIATVDSQDRVVIKAVSIGRDFGGEVEIVGGLEASDRVILNPPDTLTAGQVVRVAAAPAQG